MDRRIDLTDQRDFRRDIEADNSFKFNRDDDISTIIHVFLPSNDFITLSSSDEDYIPTEEEILAVYDKKIEDEFWNWDKTINIQYKGLPTGSLEDINKTIYSMNLPVVNSCNICGYCGRVYIAGYCDCNKHEENDNRKFFEMGGYD